MATRPTGSGPLLSLRSAVVLFFASIVGLIAGALSYLGDPSCSLAALLGGGAAAGAVSFFHAIIEE